MALPESAERDSRELEIRYALFAALQITEGYSANELSDNMARARHLTERSGDGVKMISLATGAWAALSSAGDYDAACRIADEVSALAERDAGPENLAHGHMVQITARSRIGEVAEAVTKLETHQMPSRLEGVARESLEALAPDMGGLNRLILSNLWIAEPLARKALEKSPAAAAMMRTSTALTVFNAGEKSNVLPGKAEALVNFRVAPGDTIEGVLQHVRYTIGNPLLKVATVGFSREASPVSPADSESYRLIERTIRETMPEAVVAPGLVIAGTDSRQMSGLTTNVYRFLPVRAKPEDLPRFHGTNERIGIDNYAEVIRFFHRLISVSAIEGK